jgi:hypothetical protein
MNSRLDTSHIPLLESGIFQTIRISQMASRNPLLFACLNLGETLGLQVG